MTASERKKLKLWEKRYGLFTNKAIGYEVKMRQIYNKYQEDFKKLNNKFNWCEKVSLVSFRDMFSIKHKEDFYEDNIHYTEAGNKLIAEKIISFIVKEYKK